MPEPIDPDQVRDWIDNAQHSLKGFARYDVSILGITANMSLSVGKSRAQRGFLDVLAHANRGYIFYTSEGRRMVEQRSATHSSTDATLVRIAIGRTGSPRDGTKSFREVVR